MDRNEKITRYEFKSYMNFVDLISDHRMNADLNDILAQHFGKLVEDVARSPEIVDDLVPVVTKEYKKDNTVYLFGLEEIGMNGESVVRKTQLDSNVIVQYRPTEFKPVYLTNA